MKYAYFPGCSAESTARDMHISAMRVADVLGLELIEPRGWTCCGATAGHQTDRTLAVALSAASLVKAKDMGLDMVVNCAACYNRMKVANHEIVTDGRIREQIADAVGRDYDGSVRVKHFVEVLLHDVGLDALRDAIQRRLCGLKVACYYGCLLVRPADVTGFDDPENPTSLDSLVTVMGGEALDWPYKVECCGGGLAMSRTDIVVRLTESVLAMAAEAGADCIATSCPMCQINLDMRQKDIARRTGRAFNMPIVYVTQLLGLCLGVEASRLGFEKLMVCPRNVLAAVGESGRHGRAGASMT